MIPENFVIFGAALNVLGSIGYVIDTLKGKSKPNRVTFFLWSLAPFLAFAAQITQGVGIQALLTFIVGFCPFLVLVASFFNKKSEWKLGKLDITCGVLSILGLLLWYITKVGNVAILFGILADGLAALPTIIKSYKAPETESSGLYLMGTLNGLITLFTIKTWDFAHWGFPFYIFLVDIIIYALVQFKLGKRLS